MNPLNIFCCMVAVGAGCVVALLMIWGTIEYQIKRTLREIEEDNDEEEQE